MNPLIRASAITVAIFSSIDFVAAQRASGHDHPDLTAAQQRTVNQGLANSPSQAAPSAQPQVGDKVPDSMNAQSLPTNVTAQVPEAKNLLFVKPPDRVLLIDPESKMVTEIVASDQTTTGSNSNSSSTNSSSTNSSEHWTRGIAHRTKAIRLNAGNGPSCGYSRALGS